MLGISSPNVICDPYLDYFGDDLSSAWNFSSWPFLTVVSPEEFEFSIGINTEIKDKESYQELPFIKSFLHIWHYDFMYISSVHSHKNPTKCSYPCFMSEETGV